ncbi:hypothetical protein SNS2_0391 [Streptomyces netropsis]|nr:hypothetical protein SNS2_0391 [Streptomyces netropsis]
MSAGLTPREELLLFRHCAKFPDGVREQANRLIERGGRKAPERA